MATSAPKASRVSYFRYWRFEAGKGAIGVELGIYRVGSSCDDPHQNLARARFGSLDVALLKELRTSELWLFHGSHTRFLSAR
jgi:hypothetical protein